MRRHTSPCSFTARGRRPKRRVGRAAAAKASEVAVATHRRSTQPNTCPARPTATPEFRPGGRSRAGAAIGCSWAQREGHRVASSSRRGGARCGPALARRAQQGDSALLDLIQRGQRRVARGKVLHPGRKKCRCRGSIGSHSARRGMESGSGQCRARGSPTERAAGQDTRPHAPRWPGWVELERRAGFHRCVQAQPRPAYGTGGSTSKMEAPPGLSQRGYGAHLWSPKWSDFAHTVPHRELPPSHLTFSPNGR